MSKTKEFREEIEEMDNCTIKHHTRVHNSYEYEIVVKIENPNWGLPDNVHNFIDVTRGKIKDISGISKEEITIYVQFPKDAVLD